MPAFWNNIFSSQTEPESLSDVLSKVPIFSRLKPREREAMKTFMHRRHYSAGELLFEAGEPASGMYLIRSGTVRLSAPAADKEQSELIRLGVGDFFGESTLAAPATRTVTARTLESCEIIALLHSDLLDILEKHPAMGARLFFGLSEVLSSRLQACTIELLKRSGTGSPAPELDGETL